MSLQTICHLSYQRLADTPCIFLTPPEKYAKHPLTYKDISHGRHG